jgi:hypothetical protein
VDAVLDLDPRVQLVGEPDGIGRQQLLHIGQFIGRGLVVMRDAQAERQAEHALDRGGRDPRQAGGGGFVAPHPGRAAQAATVHRRGPSR